MTHMDAVFSGQHPIVFSRADDRRNADTRRALRQMTAAAQNSNASTGEGPQIQKTALPPLEAERSRCFPTH